ncbi:hypothetical protein ScPMuIL_009056 [Solemya velum]
MARVKESCLPHLLKEYLPEYEPLTQREPVDKRVGSREQTGGEKGDRTRTQPTRNARHSIGNLSLRRHHKTDKQRLEQISDNWDRALLDLREKKHHQLKEKVALQHDLIHQQDILAHQRRAELENSQKQGRELERGKRQARNDEYKEICRQSLDTDRKANKKSKKGSKNSESQKKTEVISNPTIVAPSDGKEGTLTQNKLALFQNSLPPLCPTPPNIREDDSDDDNAEDDSGEGLPWHHQQLYLMYGQKADYFLHPKMEPETKKTINPNLRKYEAGADADTLWKMLRDDSLAKLIAEDRTVPLELKAAYSAFVRQSMGRNRKPVKRNYYAEDDVPELDRLMNQTQLRRVRNWQHKTDLMYRASQSNKDRTDVLMYNSPMPAVANKNAEKSINHYLPSWVDNMSEESVPEYQKWLRRDVNVGGAVDEIIQEETETLALDPQKTFDSELVQMAAMRKPANKMKYKFLTEAKATCKGQFSQRFKDQRDFKDVPKPADGYQVPMVSQSAMGMSASTETSEVDVRDCKSVPLPDSREAVLRQYTSQWQPLSMNALTEYKTNVDAPGEGDFGLGRPKMFTVASIS